MLLYKYRVWCTTEGAWKYTDFRSVEPTSCPDNTSHIIDPSKTTEFGVEGSSTPHADDLKPYTSPDIFPSGYFAVHAGRGDDVDNGNIGSGERMKIVTSSEGTTAIDIQFIRHVLLAGGDVRRSGALVDDEISMTVVAPATLGAENPGAGQFDKYPVAAGVNMYVPNAYGTGGWDLDLEEKFNPNVSFTKAVPVPSGGSGFFDYDLGNDFLTVNPGQVGSYNLFDAELNLTKHVASEPLFGDGCMTLTIPAVKPALCLPHWKFRVEVYHGTGSHSLSVRWKLLLGAKRTI